MKQFMRIIAVALCLIILGVTLCSCQYLEDKKVNHAVYCDDSKESLTFRGNTYRQIKLKKDQQFIMADSAIAFVTTEDVPVLLSTQFGEWLDYNSNEEHPAVLRCNSRADEAYYAYPISIDSGLHNLSAEYFANETAEIRYYVREDKLDEISKVVEKAELNEYFTVNYNTYEYDENGYSIDAYPEKLGEDITKAINASLKEGKKINYTKLSDQDWNALNWCLWAYPCDKDMNVTDTGSILIASDRLNFYLVPTDNSSPLTKDLIKVPEKYYDTFYTLARKYQGDMYYHGIVRDYFEEYEDHDKSVIEG